MILTIDVGNTNTVLGIYNEGKLVKHWRVSTDKNKTPDEYGILFYNLFNYSGFDIKKINGIVLSSVVPPVVMVLEKAARRYFGLNPLVVGPGVKTGIDIKMDNPREVGADRIVNAVGAYRKFGGPIIIVDFGTATTFCAVSEKGEYLGGAIAPGIGISTEALVKSAAKLPRIELKRPEKAIAKNTISGMQSGVVFGFVGQVEALVTRFKEELGSNAEVIATGGLVSLISSETDLINRIEPFLTLDGLYHIGLINGITEYKG